MHKQVHLRKKKHFAYHPWVADIINKEGMTKGKKVWLSILWPEYPYALPSIEEEIVPPDSEELERAFVDDMEQLQAIREEFVEKKYIGPLLQNPEDHQRRMELAHTLIQSGDFNGAISTLTPLLSTDFKPEAYYLIGFSYAGKKSFQEAVLYIEKALEHDPENRGYQYSLEVLRGEQTR